MGRCYGLRSYLRPPPQASYFDRDDVAFPGFHAYFKKQSDEEREHAEKLMKFQNQRGGRVVLQPVMKPAQDTWGTPLDALQAALELEKSVNQALLNLHKVADSHTDPQMCDFIESEFLTEQVRIYAVAGPERSLTPVHTDRSRLPDGGRRGPGMAENVRISHSL